MYFRYGQLPLARVGPLYVELHLAVVVQKACSRLGGILSYDHDVLCLIL